MRPGERRRRILGLLRQRERTLADELMWTLFTSQEIIRRNLVALAEQDLVNKFHGGAAPPPSGEHENTLQARMDEHAQEERAVTHYAASLLGSGDSIFIDTDTTILLFARELVCRSHLMAITNSLLIAGSVGTSGNRVFMIGGEYCPEPEQSVGTLAIEQIARLNAEHAVITIDALNGDGAMDFSVEEVEIVRAMIAQVRQLMAIADSSKLGRRALFQVLPLNRINRLVVDRRPIGGLWGVLQQARVEVHEAPLHTPQA